MKMDARRNLLLSTVDTVLHDCDLTVHPHEREKLGDALRGRTVFGDLLTEAICLMKTPLDWYQTPGEACIDLTPEPFVRVFSWATKEEEKLRERGVRSDEDDRIIDAMRRFVSETRQCAAPELVAGRINDVWLARTRATKAAADLGWDRGIPREIVGYLGAARAALPAVGIPALLRDLLSRHGEELTESAHSPLAPDTDFERRAVSVLEELREKGREPWAGPRRQEKLW